MIALILFVWCVYLSLLLLSRKQKVNEEDSFVLRPFIKIGFFILQDPVKKILCRKSIEKDLVTLYPVEERNLLFTTYYARKIGLCLAIFLVGFHFICFVSIANTQDLILIHGRELIRPTTANQSTNVDLIIDTNADQTRLQYELQGRYLSRQEYDQCVSEFEEQIEQYILGENDSLNEVRSDLKLVSDYDPFLFHVDWTSNNYTIIDSEGTVHNEELVHEEYIQLQANIYYDIYESELLIPICVMPKIRTTEEQRIYDYIKKLKEIDQLQKDKEIFTLPEEINGSSVTYKIMDQKEDGLYLVFLVGILVVLFWAQDSDLKKRVVVRNEEIINAYPEFISRFVLLLGAGMNVRNVLFTLSQDEYQNHYLLQELKILSRDFQNGVLEVNAIDAFGKRCKSGLYIKFCTYLIQNQKKGNQDLVPLLELEVKEAFLQKKNTAKKKGEEAGTKLLVPMMLLLVIVLVIIILPAFMSFQI